MKEALIKNVERAKRAIWWDDQVDDALAEKWPINNSVNARI